MFITAISNYHLKSCPCNEKMSSPTFCCCVYTINVIAYLFCPALIHMFFFNSQYFEKLRYFRKYYITMVYIMDVPKRVTNVTVVWLWYDFILLLLSEVKFRCKDFFCSVYEPFFFNTLMLKLYYCCLSLIA